MNNTLCAALGGAIIALREVVRDAADAAIRQGQPLAPIRAAFADEYRALTGDLLPVGAWERVEAQARVLATLGRSDRLALADAYEALTGTLPPCIPVVRQSADGRTFRAVVPMLIDDLRAEIARLRQGEGVRR